MVLIWARLRQLRGRSDRSRSSMARSRSGEPALTAATSPSSRPCGSSDRLATRSTSERRVAPAEASASLGVIDPGGLDGERHAADRREDGVDGDDADRAGLRLPVRGQVAPAPLDRQVDGQPALGVDGGDVGVAVQDLDLRRQLDVAGGDVGRSADVEADHDRLLGAGREHDVLQVQDDVGDVLGHAGDGVELVEGVIEAHRGDGCPRDRRQQGTPQGVADGVAEARLERTDGELLAVPFGLARRFDGGTLDDEHAGCSSRSWWAVCGRLEVGLLGVELDDELFADGHVDVGALGQVADRDPAATLAGLEPADDRAVEHVDVVPDDDHLLGLPAE